MRTLTVPALSLAILIYLFPGFAPQASARPVVVELFTSEGCSSCPPADRLLAEMAARNTDGRLLLLSFHVDYWNYLGWADPFSLPESTRRQRHYAKRLSGRVYTPQMVIDGTYETVGSDRSKVQQHIRHAAGEGEAVSASVQATNSGHVLQLAKTTLPPSSFPTTLWLVGFDPTHSTRVARGENSGRTLQHVNVVRSVARLRDWDGSAQRIPLPPLTQTGKAVLIQNKGYGAMLSAVRF